MRVRKLQSESCVSDDINQTVEAGSHYSYFLTPDYDIISYHKIIFPTLECY